MQGMQIFFLRVNIRIMKMMLGLFFKREPACCSVIINIRPESRSEKKQRNPVLN